MVSFPSVVAELGPGDSLGVGLAALISGVDRYIALDVVGHAICERDIPIFDSLVEMFRERRRIPGMKEFPQMRLDLESDAFPSQIIGEEQLERALAPDRIARLRTELTNRDGRSISYRAPWTLSDQPDQGSIDLIISNAVMEHVADVGGAYKAMKSWLTDVGYASHQIDFRSHGLFDDWDGHWRCPDWLWSLFMGRRPYLLNRLPLSSHLASIEEAGFALMSQHVLTLPPSRGGYAPRFSEMSETDKTTGGCYILARALP